jgi:hypothetical protein
MATALYSIIRLPISVLHFFCRLVRFFVGTQEPNFPSPEVNTTKVIGVERCLSVKLCSGM